MQETWVRSLGGEDPLEKEMAAYSSILAWRIPWMEEPGGLQFMGPQRFRHDWVTSLSLSFIVVVNLLRRVFCPSMWSILENIACALEKNMYFAFEGKWSESCSVQFSSVQTLSRLQLFATPWAAAHQACLSNTNSQSPPKLRPLSRWCHPTISSSVVPFFSRLQSFPASRVFSNESALCIRWPKY